jgi:hypothetical protein
MESSGAIFQTTITFDYQTTLLPHRLKLDAVTRKPNITIHTILSLKEIRDGYELEGDVRIYDKTGPMESTPWKEIVELIVQLVDILLERAGVQNIESIRDVDISIYVDTFDAFVKLKSSTLENLQYQIMDQIFAFPTKAPISTYSILPPGSAIPTEWLLEGLFPEPTFGQPQTFRL